MAKRYFFELYATDGFINLPTDPTGTASREKVYVFGFVGGLVKSIKLNDHGEPIQGTTQTFNPQFENTLANREVLRGTAVIPSPRIDIEVDDELYITLTNLGMLQAAVPIFDVHTIHIHGAHIATQIDGVPELTFGVPVTPVGSPEAISVTYFFKPEQPGSYFYHCHQEASEHVQMGMYGALIVYPSMKSLKRAGITQDHRTKQWFFHFKPQRQIPITATNRNFAQNDINTFYNSDWVILLSDLDLVWHNAVFNQVDFNATDFHPNYWLVNGRAFPDTLLPTTLPPSLVPDFGYNIPPGYDSYVQVKLNDKFLLRVVNMGYQAVPWHVHGWHGLIVAKDTNPRIADMMNPAHEMNFTTLVGSGESYDLLFTADDKRDIYANYIFCGQAGFPSLKEQVTTATKQSISAGTFIPPFDGATDLWTNIILKSSLGLGDFIPPYNWKTWNYGSDKADNFFFPQFYIMHNHDDYKVTNNGSYPGSQLCFIETDFPSSDYKADPPVIKEPPVICEEEE